MSSEVIVAIIALIGTALGSGSGVLVANRLMNYRIEQLEKKVEKHNNLVERMYKVESEVHEIQDKIENGGIL